MNQVRKSFSKDRDTHQNQRLGREAKGKERGVVGRKTKKMTTKQGYWFDSDCELPNQRWKWVGENGG